MADHREPILARRPLAAAPSSRLEGMDALRGIAALLVALMHIIHATGTGLPFGLGAIGAGPFGRAYLAVDLFFVLSGYVMARTYETRLAGGMGVHAFADIRLRRLWPTMAIGAVIGLAAFWPDNSAFSSLMVLVMALLFIPRFEKGMATFPTNPPAWSILLELIANALHATVLRRLNVVPLVVLALCAAAILLAYAPSLNIGGRRDDIWLGIARVLYSYTLGIVFWRWRRDRALLPCWPGLVLLPLGVIAAGFLPFGVNWADFVFVLVVSPLIVLCGLGELRFARKGLLFLGNISFPLYAVHFPVAMLVAKAGYGFVVALALSILVAWLVSLVTARNWQLPHTRRPAAA